LENNSKGQAAGSRAGYLKQFGIFWYQFLIGDDWIGAAVILFGFIGTYILVGAGVIAYWLLPLIVMFSLSLSLIRHTTPPAVVSEIPSRPTSRGIS
jgi:hypothetical protein